MAAYQAFVEFAQRNQLETYPIVRSGNGTEYKNYLNSTVFTVYHDRLDAVNRGRIELAIGVDNIAIELASAKETVGTWLLRMQMTHYPAESKPPQWWPRISLWSLEEIQRFCDAFESLLSSKEAALPSEQDRTAKSVRLPPVDERILRQILTRRGQLDFRSALLDAYGGRCAISECADVEVLEAAHIIPHSEMEDYSVTNGLLLRADLHTLFDLHLLSIDPRTAKIVVSRRLGAATYQPFNGSTVNLPADATCQPDASSLMRHFTLWQASEQRIG